MDLSKLTIPAELFYSKGPNELWKPRRSLQAISVEISQKLNKNKSKVSKSPLKHNRSKKSSKASKTPELGRIGRIKKSFLKKKFIKKTPLANVLKEKSSNIDNNNISKPSTKQEEKALAEEIKKHEAKFLERIFTQKNPFERHRKRGIGSSKAFRFFKSKNAEIGEQSDSSDESDDLVPEIRDYHAGSSRPSLDIPSCANIDLTPKSSKPLRSNLIDLVPFEEEADEPLDSTAITIESLLQNLEEENEDAEEPAVSEESTLESLISTLEGSSSPKSSIKLSTAEATSEDKLKTLRSKSETPKVPESKQKTKFMGLGKNQMQIDAGQKKFGLVECKECGFSYNTNVPEDEKIHDKHHQSVTSIPRFRGWSNEKAMEINDWREQNGRIIHLHPNHKNLKSEFVTEIIGRMELEFGVQDDNESFHVYLAVYDSKIVGLSTVKESVVAKKGDQEREVRLGIQRLYVRPEFRRKGIAKALLKTITILHNKGDLLKLQEDVAFSSPTEDGKKLIKNLLGSDKVFTFTS